MNKKNLLIVEDEGVTALEIQNKVEEWGYSVVGVLSSGEEAITVALDKRPDLILMDVVLKEKVNGIEAANIIKNSYDVPIIYLTAYDDEKTIEEAKITFPQAYLLKPFNDQELKLTIEIALYKHQMEARLKRSEETYRTLAENAEDIIFIISLEDRVDYVNKFAANILGFEPEDIVGKLRQNLFPMDISEKQRKSIDKAIETQSPVRSEIKMALPKGEMWLDTKIIPLKDKNDKIFAVMGISRDVTTQKNTEAALRSSLNEKVVLLKEIHHRVKNNMQIISSLINLQSDYATDESTIKMFEDSKHRIRTMALIHEKLYMSEDISLINFSKYIKSLTTKLLEFYSLKSRLITLKVISDDITMDIDSAIPCGLLINELLSNSIKYAFPDGREGNIVIKMHINDGYYVLSVEDDGVGFPEEIDFMNPNTLGLQIVQTLAQQLDGNIELETNGFTRFKISFKVENS
ncbi:signal transduction histidine kinase [Methanobacterium lacus]|uniref:Signal transduction histidine kinase n=1 Tax=Methanobacterium lacus (strain AL-21) TaxID=877455 RepID=F0T8N6_METLA|nr:histidine kinase dimerization/phosphoacceptor domain -containing protein [Methanobacterium lacus]ADZ08578.1 signal transduction histidine kinase [Methanobacterium lacus]